MACLQLKIPAASAAFFVGLALLFAGLITDFPFPVCCVLGIGGLLSLFFTNWRLVGIVLIFLAMTAFFLELRAYDALETERECARAWLFLEGRRFGNADEAMEAYVRERDFILAECIGSSEKQSEDTGEEAEK